MDKDEMKKCVIKRLEAEGIVVKDQKKGPKNGSYSGIVGPRREKIKINAPNLFKRDNGHI